MERRGEERYRQAIREAYRRDETAAVASMVAEYGSISYSRAAAADLARGLVEKIRLRRSHASSVEHLMHEFSLSSQEGIALMCLAEALLRIPDPATVDRLIRDKIGDGNWQSHIGSSHPLFVNATSWGLFLTGKLVATHSPQGLGNALIRGLSKGGEPLIRQAIYFAMHLLGRQFVMAETITAALQKSARKEARGYGYSFDMLGEAALTAADTKRYCTAYTTAIHAIGRASAGRGIFGGPGISVKLSALHPRFARNQRNRVMAELLPRLKDLMLLAKHYDIGVNIDAEESDRLELSFDLLAALAADPDLDGWNGLGFVVQAYQKRSPFVVDFLVNLARRSQRRLMIRLVKGAYWDSEIKRAQVDGLKDYPVFTRKAHTDLAYLVCAKRLLAASEAVYPQFATHNAHTLASIFQMAEAQQVTDYEFQCLHGMGEVLYNHVVGAADLGKRCRIYAPVGTHETLLPYLVRRLLENGANSSFVNRLVDETVSIDELITDPLAIVQTTGGLPHPSIPLPGDIYGPTRLNSAGTDLVDETTITDLERTLDDLADFHWQAGPLVAGLAATGEKIPIGNPALRTELVGSVIEADAPTINHALQQAAATSEEWHRTPLAERAAILLRAADLFESRQTQFISLCIREAGKTWANSISELREAVDFCRYYGQQLIDGNFPNPAETPGPVVCISPWNFPLAIFIGQVSAALAAGSPVLAKPAEQTPLIAHLAVQLLHEAGTPPAVLQFLPGRGETVGARLTADARIQGVVFTGSSEVARLINKSIARREGVRLIAETGGQNAMIVDSSALPEQVVQDILTSAFDSAGQRCSALRVLCLQEEIAEPTISLLKAAMGELSIGNPALLSTDIGPVIDQEAQRKLLDHIKKMQASACPVYQEDLPEACRDGSFVAPTLIEISSFSELQHEVFGPIVHILRFTINQLPALIASINATGYGLTLGIHSRIDETIDLITQQAHVGNIYVNRNMVGAVVGVQPFGGEGLSGTGPKAGGPLYLHRLAGSTNVSPAMLTPANMPITQAEALLTLTKWATANGHPSLAEYGETAARHSLLGITVNLPGPTGERNTLSFAPRGCLLCLANEQEDLLRQLASVFATGNRAAIVFTPATQKTLARLPKQLSRQIARHTADDFSGIVGVLCTEPETSGLRQHMADISGPLIPIYRAAKDTQHYPLFRLVAERVISVNTTAAGGNTRLITLSA
jgi:RHH-type transcriptional regulator, proline utilization regulon repressor / proline dehydrogenase / delta 1-pyrroline-5-carboxylate dehydrogenase